MRAMTAALTVATAGWALAAPPASSPASPPTSAPSANPRLAFRHAPAPLAADAKTSEWPSFLGPNRVPVCTETRLRTEWPAGGPPLCWEVQKGEGYSSPAVAGDKLVLFHRLGDEEVIECLHAETGKLLWRHGYATSYRDRYGFNNGPRATPVIGLDRVATIGAEGKLNVYHLASGKLLWTRDLQEEYHVPQDFFGVGSTPLLDLDRLVINLGAPGGPCVTALDIQSGEMEWKAGEEWGQSYASPTVAVVQGRRRIFVFAGGESRPPTGGLLVIDPEDGMVDGTYSFRARDYESVNASNPVIVGDQVFLSTSYQTGGVLLDILPDGSCRKAWETDGLGCHFMTPVARDGCLFGFDGMSTRDASLVCLDLATGRRLWKDRLEWKEPVEANGEKREMTLSAYRGTLLLLEATGQFLCLGEEGHLLRLELSRTGCRIVQRVRLFNASETWTPPVLSRGLLYICQNRKDTVTGKPPRVVCYDLRG